MPITDSFPHHCPKISLVTVSFNQRGYLEKCIDSILSQNYPNLEYFILDGGSTDGSAELIKRYERHLAGWRSSKDAGPYAAVNEGLLRSSGEVMGWLNSDDMMHPGGLHIIAHAFSSNPEIEWITGERVGFDKNGALQSFGAERQLWPRQTILNPLNFSPAQLFTIMQEGTFWWRTLWDRAGGSLDLSYSLASDFELWARFSRHGHLYTVNQKLGGFRNHDGSQRSKLYRDRYLEECQRIISREQSYPGSLVKPIPNNKLFLSLPAHTDSRSEPPPPPRAKLPLSRPSPAPGLPTTTIVTQSFNHAHVLERCIDSVLSAGIPNLEFIIVDQGSTDGSQEIIKRYDKFLSRVETVQTDHTFEALNRGFQVSSGALMAWIDPHAIIFKDSYHEILRGFLSNPRVSWVTGLPASIRSDGKPLWNYRRLPLHSRASVCFTNWEEPWIYPESTYWTRTLWNAAGGQFDTRWRFAGELDLWRRFFRYAQLYSIHSLAAAAEREYSMHDKVTGYLYFREAKLMMEEEYELIQRGEFPTVVPPPEPLKAHLE